MTTTEDRERVGTEPAITVELWHDPDTESPNDYDGLFRLVSFNTRHIDFEDPDTVFACSQCGESPESWLHLSPSDLVAKYRAEYDTEPESWELEESHSYEPENQIATTLNYYEHGLCRWYVAPNASPVDMGWDGVYLAGALLVEDPESWESMSPEDKQTAMVSFVDTYTDWVNGSVYGYTIERESGQCDCCGQSLEPELIDSCGGFIGSDYMVTEIRETIARDLGIGADEVTEGTHFKARGDASYLF